MLDGSPATGIPADLPDLPDLPGEVVPDVPGLPGDIPDEIPGDVPQGEPVEAHAAHVLVPDAVLDPEALIPTAAITARLEGITAADCAQAVLLGERALSIRAIDDDETEARAGALIDELTAHKEALEARVNPFASLANKLHKALTGFRGSATAPLDQGLGHLRPLLARRIRAKQEAEAKRQREAQEAALKAERERLAKEAEARQAEQRRLAEAAQQAKDVEVAAQLQAEATRAQAEAEQARFEAATVAPPPVAAQPVTTVAGAGTRDNWKAFPEHSNDLSAMLASDKKALILHVAERLKAGDESLLNLLAVDTKVATQLAKAQKSTMRIPGLRAFNDVGFTKRRG